MNAKLKIKHSDIITHQKYQHYEVIDFEKFLSREFDITDKFLDAVITTQMEGKFPAGFLRDKNNFINSGHKEVLQIRDLFFYQKEVGINGSIHTDQNEPVSIVFNEGRYILWNGYHRTLEKFTSNQLTIEAYVLDID